MCSRTAEHLPNGHIAVHRFPRKLSHITRTSYRYIFYLAALKDRLYHNNLPAECVGVLLYIGSRSPYRTQSNAVQCNRALNKRRKMKAVILLLLAMYETLLGVQAGEVFPLGRLLYSNNYMPQLNNGDRF